MVGRDSTLSSDIDRIEYIEAHGTGTPAGDPQEVNALSRFTRHRTRPLYI
ncbi:MAG: hypothetical protein P8163_02135 [Candidatus Thiodiazotropha sp.]